MMIRRPPQPRTRVLGRLGFGGLGAVGISGLGVCCRHVEQAARLGDGVGESELGEAMTINAEGTVSSKRANDGHWYSLPFQKRPQKSRFVSVDPTRPSRCTREARPSSKPTGTGRDSRSAQVACVVISSNEKTILARLRLRPTSHVAPRKLDTSTPALVTQAKLGKGRVIFPRKNGHG
jgi:hypothetical protein